jgi:hypothetical protein
VDGVSFEAEDRPAAEAKDDERAIRVVVKDAEDHPIKGAKVIVDAERKSSARAAETNDEGLATVTPQMNETERHMVRVEAEKMASVVLLPDAANTDPIEVTLRPAVKLSGVVRDAAEKPVKGACVQVALATPHNTLVRQDPAFALAQTDENGKWEAGPVADLPEGGSVIVTHPDYIKRDAVTVSFEILKGGEYVTTLEQ